MPSPSRIAVTQLMRLVGTPEAPVIVDVRTEEDFAADPRLLPASLRATHRAVGALAPGIGARRAVVVCLRGQKLSEGAAALLRSEGIAAEVLEGGVEAWEKAGAPLVPADAVPQRQADGATWWVTRARPKIDRIACPWLIRRFVDPKARFLYVAASEVAAVAERFDATPFDVEGVRFSHRGELCSFDTMLEVFGLRTEALERLAVIVRGADTERHDLAPQAAGLLAASLGLSRMYRDDLAQLEAGMALYDAFYRWARDAFDEAHDWPGPSRRGPV